MNRNNFRTFPRIKVPILFQCGDPRCSVGSVQDLRTEGRWSSLTSHNILSKPLAAFLSHNNRRNSGQR